jgi:hypothetical protein
MDMMNPLRFDSLLVDKTVFYFKTDPDPGFLELIATAWPIRLVSKTEVKLRTESVGAYGSSNSTAAVSMIKTLVVGGNMYNYTSNENVTINQAVDWYWMGEDGNLLKATRRNLLSLLPPDKARMASDFIKEQDIKFAREADLIKLLVALR